MPPQLIVEILGDTSQLERSFQRASRDAQRFGRNMEQAGRGSTIAAVGFRGLGRQVALGHLRAPRAELGAPGARRAERSVGRVGRREVAREHARREVLNALKARSIAV